MSKGENMKLYHGTHFDNLDTILNNGIVPRTDDEGNWSKFPSAEGMVYLSTTYPFYFALSVGEDITKGVVFEIESDALFEEDFYPDEDYIFQALKEKGEDVKHEDIKENLIAYQEYWKNSLEGLGNICHNGTIEPVAFTRYCVIDFMARKELAVEMFQPLVSIKNNLFIGHKYRDIIKWCFGDIELLPFIDNEPDITEEQINALPEPFKKLYRNAKNKKELWINESKDRTGIEVVVL